MGDTGFPRGRFPCRGLRVGNVPTRHCPRHRGGPGHSSSGRGSLQDQLRTFHTARLLSSCTTPVRIRWFTDLQGYTPLGVASHPLDRRAQRRGKPRGGHLRAFAWRPSTFEGRRDEMVVTCWLRCLPFVAFKRGGRQLAAFKGPFLRERGS